MGKFYYDENDYPRWRSNNKLVHRSVAEKKLGRPLKTNEVVHHYDGDKKNFKKENLRVMKRRSHGRLHKKLQGHYK